MNVIGFQKIIWSCIFPTQSLLNDVTMTPFCRGRRTTLPPRTIIHWKLICWANVIFGVQRMKFWTIATELLYWMQKKRKKIERNSHLFVCLSWEPRVWVFNRRLTIFIWIPSLALVSVSTAMLLDPKLGKPSIFPPAVLKEFTTRRQLIVFSLLCFLCFNPCYWPGLNLYK